MKKRKYKTGIEANNYKNGDYLTNRVCIDCGTKIVRPKAQRCRKCAKQGKLHPWYGRSHTEASKEKISLARTGKTLKELGHINCVCAFCKSHSLSNNSNWQDGKSFESYSIEFDSSLKETVRFRANYKCEECGCSQLENDRMLHVHHIDYNKKNNNLINFAALCTSCHTKTNFNRLFWQEHFKKKTESLV